MPLLSFRGFDRGENVGMVERAGGVATSAFSGNLLRPEPHVSDVAFHSSAVQCITL